jgi:hypothetical protein
MCSSACCHRSVSSVYVTAPSCSGSWSVRRGTSLQRHLVVARHARQRYHGGSAGVRATHSRSIASSAASTMLSLTQRIERCNIPRSLQPFKVVFLFGPVLLTELYCVAAHVFRSDRLTHACAVHSHHYSLAPHRGASPTRKRTSHPHQPPAHQNQCPPPPAPTPSPASAR